MFSYYGSKSRIDHLYPKPIYPTIIEPFAGSARYASRYAKTHKAILADIDNDIIDVWRFITTTTEDIINQIPVLLKGDKLSNHDLSHLPIGAIKLMGYSVAGGVGSPRNQVTGYGDRGNKPSLITLAKNQILESLEHIKDWKIIYGHYHQCPDITATWFIDPPYQHGGSYYKHNRIRYPDLWDWIQTLKGQIIVCENSKATWLPRNKLKKISSMLGQKHTTTECIYYVRRQNVKRPPRPIYPSDINA